jgi:pilus assembly protein CpaE
MSSRIRVILALDGNVEREQFHSVLPAEAGIEVVDVVDGGTIDGRGPYADLLLVGCGGYSENALGLIRDGISADGERPVVVLCTGSPNGFVTQAMEAGANDVVVLPESPEKVLFALEKSVARGTSHATGTGEALGRMVCVLGPKGGTGKSVTVSNLAVSLANAGRSAVVVDLDLQFGDAGLVLGLSPKRTVHDLVMSGGTFDEEKLDAYLGVHDSGARVLMAPTRPDQAAGVSVAFLREVWRVLRLSNDYVIVDTPPDFTPEVIAAVDASTDLCMVSMLDALSLKNTKLGLETLALMGHNASQVRLVLNRAGSRVGINPDDVASVLGREPDVFVPSDRDIPLSVNEGQPVVMSKPRSPAALAFKALAESLLPDDNVNGNHSAGEDDRRRFKLRRKN